jgi:hypothetical protein
MKIYFLLACIISSAEAIGQSAQSSPSGNYFTTTAKERFDNVIKPWKYQYIKADAASSDDSVKKMGQLIFWRSKAIYDPVAKTNWKPSIRYDVYSSADAAYAQRLADNIKQASSCDSINKGGDLLAVGQFILVSSSACVSCASSANIDYCRNIIKQVIASVPDQETASWNGILKQFIIQKARFKD